LAVGGGACSADSAAESAGAEGGASAAVAAHDDTVNARIQRGIRMELLLEFELEIDTDGVPAKLMEVLVYGCVKKGRK
jgi:hypothetical protein